ncbi:MAG: STAS domain-containing protein [Acidimicrobiales bacterium]
MEADDPQDDFEVHVEDETVTATGEIDVATAPQLTAAIASITDGPVVLDLSGVGFMDSSGIGALLTAHDLLAAAGRQLRVGPRSPVVDRVLNVSGADDLLAS